MLGSPTYEPLTRGMQAALPFVDDLLPVHNLASLEDLAMHLSTLSSRRGARRRQALTPVTEQEGEEAAPPRSTHRSPYPDANPTFRHPLWGRGRD